MWTLLLEFPFQYHIKIHIHYVRTATSLHTSYKAAPSLHPSIHPSAGPPGLNSDWDPGTRGVEAPHCSHLSSKSCGSPRAPIKKASVSILLLKLPAHARPHDALESACQGI